MDSDQDALTIEYLDQSVGPDATWKVVIVTETGAASAYGFTDQPSARASAVSYAGMPWCRGVHLLPVGESHAA